MVDLANVCGSEHCDFSMSGVCATGKCALPPRVQEPLELLAMSVLARGLSKDLDPEDFYEVEDCKVIMSPDNGGQTAVYLLCYFPFPEPLEYTESLVRAMAQLKTAVTNSTQSLPLPLGAQATLRHLTIFHFFKSQFNVGVAVCRIFDGHGHNAAMLEEGALGAEFRLQLAAGLAFVATRCLLGGKDACFECRRNPAPHVPLICITSSRFYSYFAPDHQGRMAFHLSLHHTLLSFHLTQDSRIADYHVYEEEELAAEDQLMH